MKQKYIEYENPFVKGEKTIQKVVRETKTRYVVRNNEVSVSYFRKLPPEYEIDGAYVWRVPHDRWDHTYHLRIKETEEGK